MLPRTEKQNQRYKNSDNDSRGPWAPDNLIAKTYSSKYDFEIITPSGRKVHPPQGYCWMLSKERLDELIKENKIWFGDNGNNVPRVKRFLNEVQSGIVPTTLWLRDEAGDTQEAVREFKDLIPDAKFDNPKPTKLLKLIIHLTTQFNSADIIMDFFAGSCTIGQAILEQNLEDNGNRKFMLVQLPEKATDRSNNFNKKFSTIADIGKERLHQTIKKINELNKQKQIIQTTKQDLGFKVFKLAKSNYQSWESPENESQLKTQLKLFENPLIDNYKDLDVIYEIIIKEGYSLNSKIEEVEIKSNKIYKITDVDFYFFICLDKQVKQASIESLKFDQTVMFVCLDLALDDSQKTNLSKICKLRTI